MTAMSAGKACLIYDLASCNNFKISDSLSPTTVAHVSYRKSVNIEQCIHTCPALIPVHHNRPLECIFVLRKFPYSVTDTGSALHHLPNLALSDVLENAS